MRGTEFQPGGPLSDQAVGNRIPPNHPQRVMRTRHAGYPANQRQRKRVQAAFRGAKDGRSIRNIEVIGLAKVSFLVSVAVRNALLQVARRYHTTAAGVHVGLQSVPWSQ